MTTNTELDATFELTEEQAFQLWKKDIEANGLKTDTASIMEILDEEYEEEN